MLPRGFEGRLIEAIQPIRQMALAHALYHLFDTKLYDTMLSHGGASHEVLAAEHTLDPERLLAFLHYLSAEGYVLDDGGWRLTGKARALESFRPWYTLLVGGYATTFQQLGAALRSGAPWAGRDGSRVGAGSCGMSAFDAAPMVDQLFDRLPDGPLTVVDLGCGDGGFLSQLCAGRPKLRGIGLDPDPTSIELAKARIVRDGLENRMSVRQGRAADAATLDVPADGTLCFLTAFVLQEMLEQEGRTQIVDLLRRTTQQQPDAYWLVVEVDHQPTARGVMAHGLGLSYYNPYFLIHAITEQRLERRSFWDELFQEAGLEVVELTHPSDEIDSTGLELGYLLRRRP